MMSWGMLIVGGVAVVSAGVGGLNAASLLVDDALLQRKKERSIQYQVALSADDAARASGYGSKTIQVHDRNINESLVAYAINVASQLSYGATKPISARVRSGRVESDKAARFLTEHGLRAGCGDRLTIQGFVETRTRLELLLVAIGIVLGYAISFELAFLFGMLGFVLGRRALYAAVLALEEDRADEAKRHVSEMLEVVALGLRSGLTFDRSFELYGSHFSSPFASDCASACRSWTLGLMTRDEALRKLASSYRCDELERAIENAIRSMRFGSSFSKDLEEMAQQSRANYKNAVRERVAKAPVKMMLPTGALILPAMLLLVLGPILLELINGF